MLAAASLAGFGPALPAAAAIDQLPDLRMAPIYGPRLERTSGGAVRLRFGTISWNVGRGPLEVRASQRVKRRMTNIVQWIKASDGSGRAITATGATAFYSRDGHDHWHTGGFIVVSLYKPDPEGEAITADEVRGLRKIGFCLTDLVRAPAELRPPNSALHRGYPVSGCGNINSKQIKIGISVGWGDVYKPYFSHQWINVTGLPTATYRLCATVNPVGTWRELNSTNNSVWVDLQINPAALTATVVASGESDCQPVIEPG